MPVLCFFTRIVLTVIYDSRQCQNVCEQFTHIVDLFTAECMLFPRLNCLTMCPLGQVFLKYFVYWLPLRLVSGSKGLDLSFSGLPQLVGEFPFSSKYPCIYAVECVQTYNPVVLFAFKYVEGSPEGFTSVWGLS